MKNFTPPALAALFLAAGLTVGCDQSASDTASGVMDSAKDAGTAAGEAGADMVDGAKDKAGELVENAKDKSADMVEGAKDRAAELTEGAKDKMAEGVDVGSLTEGMELSEEQATGMLDKVKDMISSGDTEGASSLMEKLQSVELPASVQPQVDKVKAMLDKAKEAGNALQNLSK